MDERTLTPLTSAAEGLLDEVMIARLAADLHVPLGPIHGNRRGIEYVLKHLDGYNRAAEFSPWLVLVDLDRQACAPAVRAERLSLPARFMCFRVAVRSAEAWLMGDQDRLAAHLAISPALVPAEPELLPDPKGALVNLARRSSSSTVQAEMVPRPGSHHATGPAYTARLIRFLTDRDGGWRPTEAAKRVESLNRCLVRVAECLDRYEAWLLAQRT